MTMARRIAQALMKEWDATEQPIQERGNILPLGVYGDGSVHAKQGWDGYDALPITADTTDATRYFLEILPSTLGAAYISPGADGTIGLEWIFREGYTSP